MCLVLLMVVVLCCFFPPVVVCLPFSTNANSLKPRKRNLLYWYLGWVSSSSPSSSSGATKFWFMKQNTISSDINNNTTYSIVVACLSLPQLGRSVVFFHSSGLFIIVVNCQMCENIIIDDLLHVFMVYGSANSWCNKLSIIYSVRTMFWERDLWTSWGFGFLFYVFFYF